MKREHFGEFWIALICLNKSVRTFIIYYCVHVSNLQLACAIDVDINYLIYVARYVLFTKISGFKTFKDIISHWKLHSITCKFIEASEQCFFFSSQVCFVPSHNLYLIGTIYTWSQRLIEWLHLINYFATRLIIHFLLCFLIFFFRYIFTLYITYTMVYGLAILKLLEKSICLLFRFVKKNFLIVLLYVPSVKIIYSR